VQLTALQEQLRQTNERLTVASGERDKMRVEIEQLHASESATVDEHKRIVQQLNDNVRIIK
jgi:uncharacterized protein (DUF3084 family)